MFATYVVRKLNTGRKILLFLKQSQWRKLIFPYSENDQQQIKSKHDVRDKSFFCHRSTRLLILILKSTFRYLTFIHSIEFFSCVWESRTKCATLCTDIFQSVDTETAFFKQHFSSSSVHAGGRYQKLRCIRKVWIYKDK